MDALLGWAVFFLALAGLVGLVVRSLHIVKVIANRDLHTVRDIMAELRRGR